MPHVTAIGEILWDVFPGERKLGGAPANFAWHMHGLGADATIISRVGADADGQAILAQLQRMGMDTSAISNDNRRATGRVLVTMHDGGIPSYEIVEEVAWDHLEVTPALRRVAARADVVCFGSLAQRHAASRAAVQALVRSAHERAQRVFDVNLRQHYFDRHVLVESLELATVLKLNDEEVQPLCDCIGLKTDSDPLRALLETFDLALVAMTRGADGSTLVTPTEQHDHPGIRTDVVDTVGAGDAFTAALCMGWLRGLALDRINAWANRVAAFVCTREGGTPRLQDDLTRPD